jgi:tetratricopeptide (TPR) repeat protein
MSDPPTIKRRRDLALFLFLCLLGVWATEADLDRRNQGPREEEVSYLIPAEALRPLLMGYDLIAADFLWLKTVQYVGRQLLGDKKFPSLYPQLLRVVILDPQFVDVYRLGGLFLGYTANQVDAAISLLKKGADLNPDRWELPHDLGILYYLLKHDYPQALYWLQKANGLPDRPDYVSRFVARLLASTGQKETAIEMWIKIYDQTDLSWVKDIARRELGKLGVHLRQEEGR